MGPVLYLYAAFLLFGFNVVSTCPDGDCRQLAFPEFFFFANKRLVNHSIETLQVNDFDMCQLRCYQDPNCVSINFNFNQDSQANNNCELNNATHKSHENELDAKTGYAYHGTLNACDKPRCKNGGTCQSGFTDKGYRCMCPLGFTLAHCGQDIDECSTAKHNCSHDAVCNNTIGSYICTCKKGYVGDGGNCSDIDECQIYHCDDNANCHNTKGSYMCECKTGYIGDGNTCTASGEMIFTSPYNGKSIFGKIGSNVTFTWSFSGGVDKITWGLKNPRRTILVDLDPEGGVVLHAPPSYNQRVSGVFVGKASSGQAIFTISDIIEGDSGSYTCELFKRKGYDSSVTRDDHVKLRVED